MLVIEILLYFDYTEFMRVKARDTHTHTHAIFFKNSHKIYFDDKTKWRKRCDAVAPRTTSPLQLMYVVEDIFLFYIGPCRSSASLQSMDTAFLLSFLQNVV